MEKESKGLVVLWSFPWRVYIQVEQAVDVFRDISQTSLEATAELVLADNIDILIDLMGFSSSGRPALFAMKPAPIQMHYLGYPGNIYILWVN